MRVICDYNIAAFRTRLKQCLFYRQGNVSGLRVLGGGQLRSEGLDDFLFLSFRESREHILVDVAPVVAGFDDTDLNPEGSELNRQ